MVALFQLVCSIFLTIHLLLTEECALEFLLPPNTKCRDTFKSLLYWRKKERRLVWYVLWTSWETNSHFKCFFLCLSKEPTPIVIKIYTQPIHHKMKLIKLEKILADELMNVTNERANVIRINFPPEFKYIKTHSNLFIGTV